ncbi:geranylgeranylglycerol-phosphate geranylgeranyltransferase [Candidatus Poribacteria bacterium]|nr:geranylgeranylglycerol-phosphate geranylgeranyltransferase [Candidatus Poribacteria bacterium]
MKHILSYVELARPLNGVIAFISAWLGGIFAVQAAFTNIIDIRLVLVSIASLLLLSAGNAINDYCDYSTDRINKPNRPIPSGRISRNQALIFSMILMSIGILIGLYINIYAFYIAIIVTLLLLLYAKWFKRTPFLGNIIVSCLTAITFISGGVAIGTINGTIIPAIFAFLFTTAREIVKDIEDIEGDHKTQVRTLATIDTRLAVYTALGFMGFVIIFSPIPYILGYYSWHYLLLIIFSVDIILLYLGLRLWKDSSKNNCALIQRCMKWDIFFGLGAIYFGSILKI